MRTFVRSLVMAAIMLPGMHAATAPAFNASPPDLYFNAKVGGGPPPHQVLVVNNTVAGSTLKWKASISNNGASYCSVSPSQGSISGPSGVLLTISLSVPDEAGAYYCTLTLSDNGSSPAASNTATVTVNYGVVPQSGTLPPPNTNTPGVPSYPSVAATGLSTVSFSWYASGETNNYVAGYSVYRDGKKIAVTGLTSYQDSGLATASYHTYAVSAFDSSGNVSAQAPPMAITTYAPAPADVPATYQSLYQGLESDMATDFVLINAQWAGTKYPVSYSSSLISADENGGLRTSFTDMTMVDQEIDGLQALGINAVMVEAGFPIFDQNFWEFIGQTSSQAKQTVQNYLTFYELVAQDIHGRKDVDGKPMVMIMEANPLLTVDDAADSLNASGYYQSLSLETYEQRRSANTVAIAQNVRPDFLTIQSEPDTDATNCYRPELNTPATDVAMVQMIVNNLTAADVPGLHSTIKLASGMGAWQENWQEYMGSPGAGTGLLGISGLDDIDNHIFDLNGQASSGLASQLDTSMQMIQTVQAAGKTASIGQYWPHKSLIVGENNLDVNVRDTFSFWAPLDQQFIPIIFELANQGSLQFLSSINDGQFWAYESYAALPCLPVYPATGSENVACDISIQSAEFAAVFADWELGQFSSTGTAYKAAIAEYWQPH